MCYCVSVSQPRTSNILIIAIAVVGYELCDWIMLRTQLLNAKYSESAAFQPPRQFSFLNGFDRVPQSAGQSVLTVIEGKLHFVTQRRKNEKP